MTVHPGTVAIVINNYFVRTKSDIMFVIVPLKPDTCSLKSKSMSVDSQSNKSIALFI